MHLSAVIIKTLPLEPKFTHFIFTFKYIMINPDHDAIDPIWNKCPGADSNCHALSSATPSKWCVCQFRHPGFCTIF